MNDPLVSVIIPAYNCADFLPAAIQSALDQTYSNVEIVVVNDGSPDNIEEAVRRYLDRIIYLSQENKGLSGARNAGFRASHGDFVCFLDADDTLLTDKFTKQIDLFIHEPDLGMVISGYLDIDEDGETIIQSVYKPWQRKDALSRLLNHEVFPVHAALIRRGVLDPSNPFPEVINRGEYQEDWQLWLDLALNKVQISSTPEPTCRYWRRSGSGSSFPLKHLDGARRVVNWLKQHPLAAPYQNQINKLAIIIEIERIARSWKINEVVEARNTFQTLYLSHQDIWVNPNTYLQLFSRFLNVHEQSIWSKTQDPAWFEETIINRMLPTITQDTNNIVRKNEILASAYLALIDISYWSGNVKYCRRALFAAMKYSPKICLSKNGLRSTIRGFFGSTIGKIRGN